jgi:uncharacterized protein (DUF362 family)
MEVEVAKGNSSSSLTRRDFLRLASAVGGAAALASFLEACSKAGIDPETILSATNTISVPVPTLVQETEPATTPIPQQIQPTETQVTPAETPTEVPDDGVARVAFVKTRDRAEGVRIALDLLGINPVAGKSVFLKPNFNSADPPPGSTHPDVLIALVKAIQEMGAEKITVGDRSGMGDTRRVMQQIGVFELADTMGFDVVVFDEMGPEDWALIQPPGAHWNKGFPFARPCLEAEALVQTCCLKTHRYGGHFTMSLKNSVGMVAKQNLQDGHDFMQELHASPHQRRMIAEINTAYTPSLIVLDGLEAFISGGPDKGERVSPQVILAGTDRIALDAVGVALLRYFGCRTEAGQGKIFQQEQIAGAVDLGLGVDGPGKIEFLTGDKASEAYSEEIKGILLAG